MYALHQRKIEAYKKIKKRYIGNCQEAGSTVLVLEFDYAQNLPLPKLSKLRVKSSACSFVNNFLMCKTKDEGYKPTEIVLFSVATGQNKNSAFIALCSWIPMFFMYSLQNPFPFNVVDGSKIIRNWSESLSAAFGRLKSRSESTPFRLQSYCRLSNTSLGTVSGSPNYASYYAAFKFSKKKSLPDNLQLLPREATGVKIAKKKIFEVCFASYMNHLECGMNKSLQRLNKMMTRNKKKKKKKKNAMKIFRQVKKEK
ncbi:hypothetical protein ANN_22722 [Periplaneta americana]|uniref:Uncharacterized protein n=1 Tax=Periplaneta americana TaxID=6978 RepID=A0ABQ8SJ50_PERAM|nr:hypothetical protein ANN_22722 [Periplaneta americana]